MPAYVPLAEVRPMINLENLRKQAKQFVRWHRDHHWTVAEVIRSMLPRYAQLSDDQVFQAVFRLADAQELVARRSGFGCWKALIEAARKQATDEDPSAPTEAERPRLLAAKPFVFVRDVDVACTYYVDTLGFQLAFTYGDPAFYAEVECNGLRLCIRHTD